MDGPQGGVDPTNEAQIRQKCSQAVHQSVMIGLCKDMDALLETTIDECVDDFLVTGDDMIVETSVHTFNMLCQTELEKNPQNYVVGADGIKELNDNVTAKATCTQTCSNHGVCQNGACVCDPGWMGNHCAINMNGTNVNGTTAAPMITTTTALVGINASLTMNATTPPTPKDQMCDVSVKNCSSLDLPAPTGTSPGDAVNCRFDIPQQKRVVTTGVITKSGMCECPVPNLYVGRNIGAAYVEMSVTCESGNGLGPVQQLVLYDSRCVDSNLTQAARVCIIESLCYGDGFMNPINDYEGCSPVQNT
ncbi:hypothetical protein EGW08_013467, partial [Elysia chlorotica]